MLLKDDWIPLLAADEWFFECGEEVPPWTRRVSLLGLVTMEVLVTVMYENKEEVDTSVLKMAVIEKTEFVDVLRECKNPPLDSVASKVVL